MRNYDIMGGLDGCSEALPTAILDSESPRSHMRKEVITGLSQPLKTLPCKYFYDERGSELFDDICQLPEYYLTRTELQIMSDHADAMAEAIGARSLLVEYGSGSSLKTRVLLDHLTEPTGYIPIDIARSHLLHAARALAASYPNVPIHPVCADYTHHIQLPERSGDAPARVVAYFPGSTIGNFDPPDALAFLRSIRATCGPKSGLLIGVDLKKDPAVLHAAYNDAAGVTAEFNRNILRHINRAVGSNFQVAAFDHYAFFNPRLGRMEMHLISRRSQTVEMGDGTNLHIERGESIHTESCHKFTLDTFKTLAENAGYRRLKVWTDPENLFSVQYLVGN